MNVTFQDNTINVTPIKNDDDVERTMKVFDCEFQNGYSIIINDSKMIDLYIENSQLCAVIDVCQPDACDKLIEFISTVVLTVAQKIEEESTYVPWSIIDNCIQTQIQSLSIRGSQGQNCQHLVTPPARLKSICGHNINITVDWKKFQLIITPDKKVVIKPEFLLTAVVLGELLTQLVHTPQINIHDIIKEKAPIILDEPDSNMNKILSEPCTVRMRLIYEK